MTQSNPPGGTSRPHDPNRDASANSASDATDAALGDALHGADTSAMGKTPTELLQQLTKLRQELEQAEDRALRSQAEIENYRRRVQREMADERRYATQGLLTDLLPVIDNIERAIDAAQQTTEGDALLAGVRMVHQLLLNMLERHHCRRIEAAGLVFDPTIHEAIAQLPSPQVPAGHVAHVSQQGYRLHDRVIRPAQVVVATAPAQ